MSLLEGRDGLAVSARAGQVKHPDGFVVTGPDAAALTLKGYAVRCCDFISCVVGSIDTPEASCAGIP